jgi:hypothetical protein
MSREVMLATESLLFHETTNNLKENGNSMLEVDLHRGVVEHYD